jgi:hypothetical protein
MKDRAHIELKKEFARTTVFIRRADDLLLYSNDHQRKRTLYSWRKVEDYP